ncbi:MAG: HAD-IA family hydrolase [Nocardioides sp.]
MTPFPAAMAAVRRVRAAGHRVVYLSNMPGPFADELEEVVAPVFDGGVYSGRVGHAKPEPGIFWEAERLLDLDPATLLFVDDTERNVTAARELGWPARLVAGPVACAELLGGCSPATAG